MLLVSKYFTCHPVLSLLILDGPMRWKWKALNICLPQVRKQAQRG